MDLSDVFAAIKMGAVVITVNQRLARHLLEGIKQAYIKEATVTWASPSVISFDAWLHQQWQRRFDCVASVGAPICANKTLLTKDQSLALWKRVIRKLSGAELLNIPATAKAANKARQFSLQWGIGGSNDFNTSADIAQFNQWHKAYKAELSKGDWMDDVQLLAAVSELMAQPEEIILAGFDVFTPSQKDCWALLETKGCVISEYSPYTKADSPQVFSAIDGKQEIAVMAQWARERLDENPYTVIGIVVPELESVRQILKTAFKEAFYPSATYAVDMPFEKPYNVSLGLPLTDYAPIQQALRLLQFFNQPLALNELSLLLRSSFISAGQSECGQRARLELLLRKRSVLTCSIKKLRNHLQPEDGEQFLCPILHLALCEVIEQLAKRPNRVTPSEWVGVFRGLLTAIDVQGDRELSSTEYQVFKAWDEGLRTFAALDTVQGAIDYPTALSALRCLMGDTVFQPETTPAPIQIMGLMEAAGHGFDALWVCGLHDQCWPPAPQPSPFLPIVEQRKQGLIQSSAEHQHKYAKQVTQNWQGSAQTVIFSYATSNGETPQLKSPLLDEFAEVSAETLLKQQPINLLEQRLGSEHLSLIEDISGPVVETEGVTCGGVGVLKDQSACPFKAFAHFRLAASAVDEPEPGIDTLLRGTLVHRSLEAVWKKIETHQALCELPDDKTQSLVNAAVSEVIEHESYRTPILKNAFGRLEIQRISELLLDWLAIDKQREPFSVVDTERKQVLAIGQLQLNTAIDRVDTLEDASTAIIDYKTGETKIGSWFGERPEEPQLPLYSVFGSEGVHSISFAQLKKGATKYVGLSDRNEHFTALKNVSDNKVKADESEWAAQMEYWKTVMTNLSDEFVAGDARVNPTKKACDYCDLTSLCRINEQDDLQVLVDE
ncbi:MAG: DNA helicase [Cycloclasticus sp. symbiont of Poecilosclerida sp. M]|nr:MAG: DNA helicase [Cycloclasticus sp. symbiont of Poecilosclerida sp. M]